MCPLRLPLGGQPVRAALQLKPSVQHFSWGQASGLLWTSVLPSAERYGEAVNPGSSSHPGWGGEVIKPGQAIVAPRAGGEAGIPSGRFLWPWQYNEVVAMGKGHRCAERGVAPTTARVRRPGIRIPSRPKVWLAGGTCPKNQGVVEQRLATDKVRKVCPVAFRRGAVVKGGPCS